MAQAPFQTTTPFTNWNPAAAASAGPMTNHGAAPATGGAGDAEQLHTSSAPLHTSSAGSAQASLRGPSSGVGGGHGSSMGVGGGQGARGDGADAKLDVDSIARKYGLQISAGAGAASHSSPPRRLPPVSTAHHTSLHDAQHAPNTPHTPHGPAPRLQPHPQEALV